MVGSNGRKRKVSGMVEINQNQGFISPNSYESADQDIGLFLKQKFAKLHSRQKEQWIANAVHNLYGRHREIEYKREYNFRERWEQNSKPSYFESKQSLIKTQNLMPTSIQIILLLFFAANIWFLTIYRIFNTNDLIDIFIPIIIITQIMDIFLKMYFIKKAIEEDHDVKAHLKWLDYFKLHWSNLFFVPYSILILCQELYGNSQKEIYLFLLDLFFIWRAYIRIAGIYDGINIRIMASKYRNQLQVIKLLTRCIYVVHFIGIFLYFVTKQNAKLNWAMNIQDYNDDWVTRYIYSLYFASTTLTTVGYGDFTPKNLTEIVSVLFIQIFGIINFGYIINQIGRILAKINEKNEVLTKNISQAENIAQTYKIPENLALQMRDYIINNQIAHDQINIEQEDSFMRKLNDQIREGFNSLNQIRIIKSSIFFLCHWSKRFQRNIASKLIRNIYSPQESLIQIQGKEKLYILTRGKIDVFACLIDRQNIIKIRPLKVIELDPKKQVHNNSYGYSSLVSGLQIKLRAVVKDYSICYSLTRQDFLNAIMQDGQDFEYFHKMKCKIEQSYHKQVWQAPSMSNTREHYSPNPFYVVMRDRQRGFKQRAQRKSRHRRHNKTKSYIQAEILPSSSQSCLTIEKQNSQSCIIGQNQAQSSNKTMVQKMMPVSPQAPYTEVLTERERTKKYQTIVNNTSPYLIRSRGYSHKKHLKNSFEDELEKQKEEEKMLKQSIMNDFQEHASYVCFFPKANLDKALEKYQKIYHKKIFFEAHSQKSPKSQRSQKSQRIQTMNKIPEDVMNKILNIRVFGSQSID